MESSYCLRQLIMGPWDSGRNLKRLVQFLLGNIKFESVSKYLKDIKLKFYTNSVYTNSDQFPSCKNSQGAYISHVLNNK